ncbi:MAG: PilT/PilU family type 4a pilus ATPase [Oscillospiraceae bacterium]
MQISELVAEAAALGASDIHLICGLPPKCRVDGTLRNLEETCLTDALCTDLAEQMAGKLPAAGELDLAETYGGIRVRINLFRQQTHFSASIRLLNNQIPALESLGLPPAVAGLTELPRGIVLVTGETGSGKSTTLAAMIDSINHSRAAHIITLEDPIEYVYTPDRCIFNQREIGRDTASYASGLRAALREDPDIMLVGEMRDLDTIETALTAAETGHLVLTTLHTGSAADAIDRMVDVFPAERQKQIRLQLSMTLQAVLSQQLLPHRKGSGRVAACELMLVNAAIRNLIREGKTPQIGNVITTTGQEGAITMDNALLRLCRENKITSGAAKSAARDPEYLRKNL